MKVRNAFIDEIREDICKLKEGNPINIFDDYDFDRVIMDKEIKFCYKFLGEFGDFISFYKNTERYDIVIIQASNYICENETKMLMDKLGLTEDSDFGLYANNELEEYQVKIIALSLK